MQYMSKKKLYALLVSAVATIVATVVFPGALEAQQAKPKPPVNAAPSENPVAVPAQIDKNGVLILVRSALHALDLSNKSGNYSILRDIGAPGFAAINDSSRLSDIFRKMREDRTDLSGVLVYEPQLTIPPQITKDGMLHIGGVFPSPTSQINFELVYAPVNGRWKLMGLSANVGPSGPVAPMPAQQGVSSNGSSQSSPKK